MILILVIVAVLFIVVTTRNVTGGGGGGNGAEFQVGEYFVFYGAPGGPGNAAPLLIIEVGADYYRYELPAGGQGSVPFAYIDEYRAAGGTVETVAA